jgi:hypothetical protein
MVIVVVALVVAIHVVLYFAHTLRLLVSVTCERVAAEERWLHSYSTIVDGLLVVEVVLSFGSVCEVAVEARGLSRDRDVGAIPHRTRRAIGVRGTHVKLVFNGSCRVDRVGGPVRDGRDGLIWGVRRRLLDGARRSVSGVVADVLAGQRGRRVKSGPAS